MTTDQLRTLISARPFQPFTIHLADGRQVQVSHPEVIAYAGGRIAGVARADDAFEIVDLLLVTSLVVQPAAAGQAG
jgi:hypothetical protein